MNEPLTKEKEKTKNDGMFQIPIFLSSDVRSAVELMELRWCLLSSCGNKDYEWFKKYIVDFCFPIFKEKK